MTFLLWILFAGAALAQTAAPPANAGKAAVPPRGADKTAAPPANAGKTAAPPANAAEKKVAPPGAGKTAATPPNAAEKKAAPPGAGKTAATPPNAAEKKAAPPDAGKVAAPTTSADKAAVPPPGADKTAALPANAEKTAAPPGTDKVAAPAKPADTFQSAMAKQRAAIAVQRLAVRQQNQTAVPWMLATPRVEAAPGIETAAEDCDPIADPELTPLIESAAQQHQVEPRLLRGVIEQESGFHACAISAKGAKGLMQLMPATIDQFKVDDVFDPKQNIEAGATYLRQLLDKYKDDLKLALAAYNAGPTTVDQTGGIPDIKETRDYVEGVLKKMQ